MRYELDANGYILAVYFGCYSGTGKCKEYTGIVPSGYTDLNDWSEKTLINAYYIDENGNLVLDTERLKELEEKIEQDTIDNEPLLRKDLYGTSDVLDTQYQNATATGNVITIDNVKKLNPKVKITNIDCYKFSKVDIITQSRNMLKVNAVDETIEGITFTKLMSGGIKINGTATADIEYNLAGSDNNLTSLFALKKNKNYYLNIGSLDCEMKYYDGTTSQVYTGASGVINLSESKAVTQVLIKIPSGTTLNETIYPMLECGSSASAYEGYKHRILTIDFNELVEEGLFPSDYLFPSDDLFPKGTTIDYISIEDSKVYVSANGLRYYLMKANVNLFDGYNTIYTMQDTNIEMTYCINNLKLEGTVTKNNNFRVLEDGSIEAHNGYFSGKIEAESGSFKGHIEADSGTFTGTINSSNGKIGGYLIDNDKLYSHHVGTYTYSNADMTKIRNYMLGTYTLTTNEKTLYDVNGDGEVNALDYIRIRKAIDSGNPTMDGTIELSSENVYSMLRIKDKSGNIVTDIGMNGFSTTAGLSASSISCDGSIGTNGVHSDKGDITVGIDSAGNKLIELSSESGTIRCVSVNQTSLKENKKNIEIFEDALPIINNIDIHKYNYKLEEDGHKKHLGFVIGQGYNYSSEITAIDEKGKEIGVDLYSMTSLCLQAIKELSNKVKILEDKIKEMESDN